MWPLPLHRGQKRPALGSGWQDVDRDKALTQVRDGRGVGLHLVGLWQVDVDLPAIRDEVLDVLAGAVPGLLERACVRWTPRGGEGDGMHVIVRVEQDGPRVGSTGPLRGVELRGGHGQQVAVWTGGDPDYEDEAGLPLLGLGTARPLTPREVETIVRGLETAFGRRPEPSRNGQPLQGKNLRNDAPSMTVEQALAENLTPAERQKVEAEQADDLPKLLDALGRSTPPPDRESWIRVLLAATAVARNRRWPQGEVDAALRAWCSRGARYEEREDSRQLSACWARKLDGREATFGTLVELLSIDQLRGRPASVEQDDDDAPQTDPVRRPIGEDSPVEVLPPELRDLADAVGRQRRRDPVLGYLAGLSVLSGCVGCSIMGDIGLDSDAAGEPLNAHLGADPFPLLFHALLLGWSADGKSSFIDAALAPVRAKEELLLHAHRKALETYQVEAASYDVTRKAALKTGSTPPPKPTPPPRVGLVFERTTFEALTDILSDNPRGIILAADELSNLVRGVQGETLQALLGAWKAMAVGGTLKRHKVGRGRADESATTYVRRAVGALLFGTQPGVFQKVLLGQASDPEMREGGILGRVPVYKTEFVPPKRAKRVPVPAGVRTAWSKLVSGLLRFHVAQELVEGRRIEDVPNWSPLLLPFTDRARELLESWELDRDLDGQARQADDPLAGLLGRGLVRAAAISGLLFLSHRKAPRVDGLEERELGWDIDDPMTLVCPAWAVTLGCRLADWLHEAARGAYSAPCDDFSERWTKILAAARRELEGSQEPLTVRRLLEACNAARPRRGEKRGTVLREMAQVGLLTLTKVGKGAHVTLGPKAGG